MKPLGVPFTIDVFGMTTNVEVDLGIGQIWEDLVTTADVVLPMVYPSHYYHAMYGAPHPNNEPYRVVKGALADALRRNKRLGSPNMPRSAHTCRPSRWAGPDTLRTTCGSRSAPRPIWASTAGCCGTRAPPMMRGSSTEGLRPALRWPFSAPSTNLGPDRLRSRR